jgi:hypothetical protein
VDAKPLTAARLLKAKRLFGQAGQQPSIVRLSVAGILERRKKDRPIIEAFFR